MSDEHPKGLTDEDGRLKKTVSLDDDEPSATVRFATLGRVGPGMITIVVCLIAVYVVPGLEFFRPWVAGKDPLPFWNVTDRPFVSDEERAKEERIEEVDRFAEEVLAQGDAEPPPPVDPPPTPPEPPPAPDEKPPPYEPRPEDTKPAVQSLELEDGTELDAFFASLSRVDLREAGAVTRVVHWGDSVIGMDGIPGAIRRRMQNRFGDAGHGWHLMTPPNTSYRHSEVRFRHNEGWSQCFIIEKCKRDGRYGLGGSTAWAVTDAQSSFAPSEKRSSGKVSRFELFYLAHPRGGRLKVQLDKQEAQVLETRSEALEDRVLVVEPEDDGLHKLTVRAAGHGQSRVYGVVMERDGPGVVWDSAALVGAFTKRMSAYDPEHLAAQLEHRQPQLAVLTFGGNDMIRDIDMGTTYADEYRAVIRMLKAARPEMACLIMAPLDHGVRRGVRIETNPVVPQMVDAQRKVAREEGCAFFDSFSAMGGEGSAGRWYKQTPRLMGGDLGHATAKGHQVIGEALFRALVEAYVDYRRRTDPNAEPDAEPDLGPGEGE